MSGKPKILIMDNSLGVTGALVSILRSSSYLKDSFNFVFLLPARSKAVDHVRLHGFDTRELPMQELARNMFSIVTYVPILLINVWRFFALQRTVRADVIHANDAYNLIPPFYKMFGGKASYVCHFRFMPSRFPGAYLRVVLGLHNRYASKIVAVSNAVANELPSAVEPAVVYDGLPPANDTFKESSGKLILFPASYTRGKGHEDALKAFAVIAADFPGWRMRFMGSDFGLTKNKEYKGSLDTLLRQLNLVGRVDLAGESGAMEEEYLNASMVLNFSFSESLSLTCQEALYYGRPVIATRSGGPTEIVADGETGMLVPVGDIDAMVAAMKSLLGDEPRRLQMGRLGMQMMRDRFAPEKTFERLKLLYLEAQRHSA